MNRSHFQEIAGIWLKDAEALIETERFDMDKAVLVEKDFENGETLIRELDKDELGVHSALWLYNSESEHWR